jgi:hypothetical protein
MRSPFYYIRHHFHMKYNVEFGNFDTVYLGAYILALSP